MEKHKLILKALAKKYWTTIDAIQHLKRTDSDGAHMECVANGTARGMCHCLHANEIFNGTTDETVELIKELFPGKRYTGNNFIFKPPFLMDTRGQILKSLQKRYDLITQTLERYE